MSLINKYYDTAREKVVLKAVLMASDQTQKVAIAYLKEHLFFEKLHRHFCKIIKFLDKEGKPISFTSLKDYINLNESENNQNPLKQQLTAIYDQELKGSLDDHVDFLESLYKNRIIDDHIVNETKRMLNDNASPQEILLHIQKSLAKIVMDNSGTLEDAVDQTMAYIERCQLMGQDVLKTGLKEFDEAIGIRMQRYFIIAALSSVGKSLASYALLLQIAKNNSFDKFAIKYFSLELPKSDVLLWLIANLTSITFKRLEGGGEKLSEQEIKDVKAATKYLKSIPLSIDDDVNYIEDIELKSKKFILDNPGKHIIIMADHHLKVSKRTNDMRQHVSDLSAKLQNIAKHDPVSVFLLAQLRRDLLNEKNAENNYRPSSEYIQESGSLFQDANHVICLWRPDMYTGIELAETHHMHWIIEKNKNGQKDFDIILNCTPKYGQIEDPNETLPF